MGQASSADTLRDPASRSPQSRQPLQVLRGPGMPTVRALWGWAKSGANSTALHSKSLGKRPLPSPHLPCSPLSPPTFLLASLPILPAALILLNFESAPRNAGSVREGHSAPAPRHLPTSVVTSRRVLRALVVGATARFAVRGSAPTTVVRPETPECWG